MQNEPHTRFYEKAGFLNKLFWFFVLLFVAERLLIYLKLSTVYIDSDQPFMWIGARDYAQGLFKEPRFYGQDYNTFMEALFAVPFIWLKLPVYYALPLATHLLFSFCILFPAIYTFRKGKKVNAILMVAVCLCLPFAFGIITGIPRGFVTGIAFTAFYVLSIFNPHNKRYWVLNTVLTVIAYFVNSNVVLVAFPFFFYLFLQNFRNLTFYYILFGCSLLYVPLDLFFNGFYVRHPSYVVYGLEYAIRPMYFWKTFTRPNEIFGHINFFMEDNCYFLSGAFVALGVALFRQNRQAFYTLILFLLFILFTFCISKTWDGTTWPFYSFSRMYIGIPIAIILLLALLHLRSNKVFLAFVAVCIGFVGYKAITLKEKIAYHTQMSHWAFDRLSTLGEVINADTFYRDFCTRHKVDHLFISTGFFLNTYINYGGPAIFKDYPKTQESSSERRYWVVQENRNKVIPKFVYISSSYDMHTNIDTTNFDLERLDYYGLYLVKNNRLTTDSFFKLTRKAE